MAETTTTGPRIDNLNATLSRSPQEGDDDNVVDYTINESGGDGRGVHLHLIKNSLTNQYPGNYILYRGTVNGKDRASSVAVTINADGHMVSISVAKYLFFCIDMSMRNRAAFLGFKMSVTLSGRLGTQSLPISICLSAILSGNPKNLGKPTTVVAAGSRALPRLVLSQCQYD